MFGNVECMISSVISGAELAAQHDTQMLPVHPVLAELLPAGGLPPGQLLTIEQSTSLVLALLAYPSQQGAWCAMVGFDDLGLAAANEAGIAGERLVLIPNPAHRWEDVVAALVRVMDIVVLRCSAPVPATTFRRLQTRTRQNKAVLMLQPVSATIPGASVALSVVAQRWHGPDAGAGSLRTRQLQIKVAGRGVAARQRTVHLRLPGEHDAVELVP